MGRWEELSSEEQAVIRHRIVCKKKLFKTQKECAFCGVKLTLKKGKKLVDLREQGFALGTLEHIIPLGCGGDDSFQNLTLSCWGCNHKRGATGFLQFLCSRYAMKKQRQNIRTAINHCRRHRFLSPASVSGVSFRFLKN